MNSHTEVYRGYEALEKAHPDRIIGVEASGLADDVEKSIRMYIEGAFRYIMRFNNTEDNRRLTERLERAVSGNAVSHAYIFEGPSKRPKERFCGQLCERDTVSGTIWVKTAVNALCAIK